MPRFDPEAMFRMFEAEGLRYVLIGGLAATLHGSPLRTGDADVCPERSAENLERLSRALRAMQARIRTADAPGGLAFACDPAFFGRVDLVNLTTQFGDLDVAFVPAGTTGYAELASRAVAYDLGNGLIVPVADLADVIRSKEVAGRDRDRAALPTLRALLDRMKR